MTTQVADNARGQDTVRAWYAAVILAAAGALSQIDRQIMGLLMEPVKLDLHLSDVQVSLLYGLAFVLFHTLAAFPLGYLADRTSRRTLVAVSILLWSIATAWCGLASSFVMLFSARMAVGIGESTLQPATQSMLPDLFSPRSMSIAFALVQVGVLIGGGTAYVLGGAILGLIGPYATTLPLIGALEPWQLTFLIVSLAGPVVALLMLTIREPVRRTNPTLLNDQHTGSLRSFLKARRGFLAVHLAMVALTSVLAFGVLAWTPSFLIRTFHWPPAKAGMVYGLVLMFAGGAGTLVSSLLARRWSRIGQSGATARVNLLALIAAAPLAVAFPLVSVPAVALACLAGFSFCVGVTSTMMPVTLQMATPHALRGRIAALYVFATSAVGAALGPVIVAIINQYLFGRTADLNLSIALTCAFAAPAATILAFASDRQFSAFAHQ